MDSLVLLRKVIARFIWLYYRCKNSSRQALMFIPHSGVSKYDYIDLFNYESDSAMTFAHYLLANNLCPDKEFILFSPSKECIEESYNKAQRLFPNRKFVFLSWDSYDIDSIDYRTSGFISKTIEFCKCISRCSHIFTSTTYRLKRYISHQMIVDLNYYPAPFKNDLLSKKSKYYMGFDKVGREYSMIMFTSEMAIRLEMPSLNLPRDKFNDLGLCRNDNLYNNDGCSDVRERIISSIPYHVSKLVLYIPTHRDYEQGATDVMRSLFGYPLDFDEFDSILREEGIAIICKIHPKQNRAAISAALPKSVLIHSANHEYGLYELMKASDCLISDYSTGYFDYLLLDKPVIFNFYDIEKYKKERGFTFNPIESITAGDIVKTKDELYTALKSISKNAEDYRDKRAYLRDLFFAYQDKDCCRRVYDVVFGRVKEQN